MPELPDVTPGEVIASDHINDLRDRAVLRYADIGDRDTSVPTPASGDVAYVVDEDRLYMYNGAGWASGGLLPLTGGDMSERIVFPDSAASAAGVRLSDDTGGTVTFSLLNEISRMRLQGTVNQFAIHGAADLPIMQIRSDIFYLDFGVDDVRFRAIDTFPTTSTPPNLYCDTGTAKGRLWLTTSARKYKSDIEPAPQIADYTLEPVTFHHDGDGLNHIGFIADDLAAQDPLIGLYRDGEIDNYNIQAVVAILAAKVNRLEEMLDV